MTIEIKVSTDMHTMSFKPDIFSLTSSDREYLGQVLERTGSYIIEMEDVNYEFSKQSKTV